MTRSPEKARNLPSSVEGYVADLDSPESLSNAFEGVDGVFLLAPVSLDETRRGLAAVTAAKSARVRTFVYLSVAMPEGSTVIPHFNSKVPIENAIKDSGIAFTVLRPNNFFQNDLSVKDTILRYGLYPTPLGAVGLNRVDVRDIADCAVAALTRRGFEGWVVGVHGPDTLTGADVAGTYSAALGREVRYVGDDLDAWEARVRNVMPLWWVRDYRVMYKFYQDHGSVASAEDLERMRQLLGGRPRRFEDFAKEMSAAWDVTKERAA